MNKQKDIIEYFDKSKIAYKDIWHLDTCLALHYGFWEKGVYNLKQALIKENEVLAKTIDIKSSDVVLDAGCGVGGSAIYLSKTYNCHVHGITLSEDQVVIASRAAKKNEVSDLLNFSVVDFHKTPFSDNFFDVIWFTESFGYSDNPEKLLCEMYRILKPNGRIVIADGFMTKENNNEKDTLIIKKWLNNWAVNTIPISETVTNYMTNIGYCNIKNKDYSNKVSRSAFIMYCYAKLALAYGKVCRLIGKSYGDNVTIKNTIGAKFQYKALRKGLWRYKVISASKAATTIN